jgi:hypothetical protein
MPATFKVIGTLALRSQKQFIVLGDLIDGEIHRGMQFAVPREGAAQAAGRVDAIEFVDFMSLRADCPALVLRCEDPKEIDTWRDLLTEGLVLSLK